MESTRIHLLEKLSLCSIVLPYLPTHRSFLILSSFSHKSREMLEQNYRLFVRLMRRSCLNVAIRSTCLDKLWLPSDLFTFHVHNWLDFCEPTSQTTKAEGASTRILLCSSLFTSDSEYYCHFLNTIKIREDNKLTEVTLKRIISTSIWFTVMKIYKLSNLIKLIYFDDFWDSAKTINFIVSMVKRL